MARDSAAPSLARFAQTRVFGSLDGLRCLSIAAVVWHHSATHPHAFALARNGFLGVDLFFAISGFLITTLLLRERHATGGISLRRFFMRRTLRIFPPYFALLAATAFALWLVFPGASMRAPFFAELPYLATYTSNWVEISTLFGITWSLATEEQFYLVWPSIERFASRFAIPLLCTALVLNQAVNFGLLDAPLESLLGAPRREFAVLQTTFTPILLGAALAHALAQPGGFAALARVLGRRSAGPLALAAIGLLASIPGPLTGAPRLGLHVAMGALVGACAIREDNGLRALLTLRPLTHVGAISYGIYLYHLIALHFVLTLGGALRMHSNFVQFLTCALLAIAIAEVSYRVLEVRFLRLKTRFEAMASR